MKSSLNRADIIFSFEVLLFWYSMQFNVHYSMNESRREESIMLDCAELGGKMIIVTVIS